MWPTRLRRFEMSYAEYLAGGAKAEIRHEYLNGEVWEMAGGTIEHGALAAALIGEFRTALRGKPCRTRALSPAATPPTS